MRERLDSLLVARGLFATRAQARGAVLAGEVRVDGFVSDKPGTQIAVDARVDVAARPRFVSRGGDKLDHAMAVFGIDVTGEEALDLGVHRRVRGPAAAGGAAHVVAVDVGYGQLDWGLREDPRVTVMERTNARDLTPERLPYAASFVTADLSFISLTVALGPVLECLRRGYRGLVLVKPQFERAASVSAKEAWCATRPCIVTCSSRSPRGFSSEAPWCSACATPDIPDQRGTWST